MDMEHERQFIREHFLRRRAEQEDWVHPSKSPPYDPEDGGVPPEMHDGPVDAEGWVEWRLLPSTVTDADLDEIEGDFGVKFPPLFRAYYSTFFHMFDQSNNGRVFIILPDAPSDDPLGPLVREIEAWEPLLLREYLAFGSYEDGWGPLCFDLRERTPDGDYPIVWIDHELIPDPEGPQFTREALQSLAKPVYGSFRELFVDHFVAEPTPLHGLGG